MNIGAVIVHPAPLLAAVAVLAWIVIVVCVLAALRQAKRADEQWAIEVARNCRARSAQERLEDPPQRHRDMSEEGMNRAERRKLVSRYRIWRLEGSRGWGWEILKPARAGSGTAKTHGLAVQAAEEAKRRHRRQKLGRWA